MKFRVQAQLLPALVIINTFNGKIHLCITLITLFHSKIYQDISGNEKTKVIKQNKLVESLIIYFKVTKEKLDVR